MDDDNEGVDKNKSCQIVLSSKFLKRRIKICTYFQNGRPSHSNKSITNNNTDFNELNFQIRKLNNNMDSDEHQVRQYQVPVLCSEENDNLRQFPPNNDVAKVLYIAIEYTHFQ